jgi:hypothetical protein
MAVGVLVDADDLAAVVDALGGGSVDGAGRRAYGWTMRTIGSTGQHRWYWPPT